MEAIYILKKASAVFFKLVTIILLVMLCCCNKKQTTHLANPTQFHSDKESVTEVIQAKEDYRTNSNYQYKHRSGASGHYEYTYDVHGYDAENNEVSGSISIEGDQGIGLLTDVKENEIEVDVEWIDYGKLKATDKDGNEYELEVI